MKAIENNLKSNEDIINDLNRELQIRSDTCSYGKPNFIQTIKAEESDIIRVKRLLPLLTYQGAIEMIVDYKIRKLTDFDVMFMDSYNSRHTF